MLLGSARGPTRQRSPEDRRVGTGVQLVWVVYPSVEQVHVYSSPTSVRILTRADELSGDPVVPGFRLCGLAQLRLGQPLAEASRARSAFLILRVGVSGISPMSSSRSGHFSLATPWSTARVTGMVGKPIFDGR